MDGLVAEVAHDVVEPVVALHHVARPADEIGRLLDVAERLEPVLADLHREQRAELHLALADHVGDPAQDRDAFLPRPATPASEGFPGRSDRVLDVRPGALRERAHHRAVDRSPLLERPVTVAFGATDEVAVRPAEHRPGLGQAGLVLGVELLVVVAERGVGDLQARLRLGRHRGLRYPLGVMNEGGPRPFRRSRQGGLQCSAAGRPARRPVTLRPPSGRPRHARAE